MKTFACHDLGMDCNFAASGDTVDDVKKKALAHAQQKHADLFKGKSQIQMAQLEETIVNKIH